jgi:protein phosphatase
MDLHQIKTELPVSGYCESRIGGRSENQDSYGYQDTPFGLLVTVCDGMGGGPGGKTASTIAVREIIAGVMEANHDNSPENVLLQAIHRANLAILDAAAENPKLQGMGTTCTAVLVTEKSAIVAHVGDSRVYQLRRHSKIFRTFDHSMVFELVKQKVITEEQARLSEQSNYITRALGIKSELDIEITERPYEKGDRFLLCTDGIHGTMPEIELLAMATKQGNLGKVVDDIATFVDGQGRSKGGGHDNLTLAMIEMQSSSTLKDKKPLWTKIVIAAIAVLAVAGIAIGIGQCSKNSKKEKEQTKTENLVDTLVQPEQKTDLPSGTLDVIGAREQLEIMPALNPLPGEAVGTELPVGTELNEQPKPEEEHVRTIEKTKEI